MDTRHASLCCLEFRNHSFGVLSGAVFAALCWSAACSTALAQQARADETWRQQAEETIAATCAMRGLEIKSPLRVLPMGDFQGGYTEGIGSAVWDTDHARVWREGWCALGVYCAQPDDVQNGSNARTKNLEHPLGLYDRTRNALFVSSLGTQDAAGTIAHETVHALQYQNFPRLNAAHLWRNRDLDAAVNSVIEGDAHLVGSSFDSAERVGICMTDSSDAIAASARAWDWQPNKLSALGVFPHVFGIELTLKEMLTRGPGAMDALLQEPPLSTLAVLKPELADLETEFIRLPPDLVDEQCTAGLRNTAGVVGIWGLLREHGDVEAAGEELPALLAHWRGDRFLHLSCPGNQDDELAWLIRWSTPEAAARFATSYSALAGAIPAYGGVLGSVPQASVDGRSVIIMTAGLRDAVEHIANSEIRNLSRYSEWVESDCFPDSSCENSYTEFDQSDNDLDCADVEDSPSQLREWLDRIRKARATPVQVEAGLSDLTAESDRLNDFCAVNGSPFYDLYMACYSASYGSKVVAPLIQDPSYRGVFFCMNEAEIQEWVRSFQYPEESPPFSPQDSFISIYGMGRAASGFADSGVQGLHDLMTNPPLSSLALLQQGAGDVDLIGLPRRDFQTQGCEVTDSKSLGALGIWRMLVRSGVLPEGVPMPALIGGWKGDRLVQVRCQSEEEGQWAWISRWRTVEAATSFAAHYPKLLLGDTGGIKLPMAEPVVEGSTVWIIPENLQHLESVLKDGIVVREFQSFEEWVQSGCFPQESCRSGMTSTTVTDSEGGTSSLQ